MADGQPPLPGVVMFDKSAAQTFYNSSFAATGRDHVTVNVAVATTGQPPSPPIQEHRSRARNSSLFSRFLRVFRRRKRRLSHDQPSRGAECVPPSPEPVAQPAPPAPTLPVRPSLLDVAVLADGSSLSSIDTPSKSPPPRPSASNEEEVYERSFLPKGQGYPMYYPSPLGASVKLGDIGIITQDGFQSFGNLYFPEDQSQFCLEALPTYEVVHQSEKFQEGQTFVIGMEDAKKPTNGAKSTTRGDINSFEFHCRQAQGAVLAITSSAQLDTLSPLSRNELRQYLCRHGTRLVAHLRGNNHLSPGESLYVVTGTIKSDTWGIAVHTSPMKEPYDHVVLARRTDKGTGALADTYEWTSKGNADARYGASSSLDDDGRRTKDQSLFLRGFLITPSAKFRYPARQSGDGGSSTSNPSSGSDSPDSGEQKGGTLSQGGKDPRSRDSSRSTSTISGGHQLHDLPETHVVLPFPGLRSKNYYPSQRINEMLLQNLDADLAVTHDDDWRHMVEDRYLDNDCLDTLTDRFRKTTSSSINSGVATILPAVDCMPDSDPPCSIASLGQPFIANSITRWARARIRGSQSDLKQIMSYHNIKARDTSRVFSEATTPELTPDATPDFTPWTTPGTSPDTSPATSLDTSPDSSPLPERLSMDEGNSKSRQGGDLRPGAQLEVGRALHFDL